MNEKMILRYKYISQHYGFILIMAILQELKSKPRTRQTFRDVVECLKSTAEYHDCDMFDIISFLDSGKTKGFRKWFAGMAKDFWRPQAIKHTSERSPDSILSIMPIIITGARPGEIIIGTKTQSKDAVIKIVKGIVPPRHQILDSLREDDDVWRRFLSKLSNINYFAKLSIIEREMWLEEYQTEDDVYLEDVDGLEVSVLDFGSSDLLSLPEDILEQIGDSTAIFDMKEIADSFTGKPGSEGLKGRHTLMFRRGIWKVSTVYHEVESFDGPVIQILDDVTITLGAKSISDSSLVTFDTFASKYSQKKGKFSVEEKKTIGMLIPKKHANKKELENMYVIDPELLEKVRFITRGFTAAGYKSLLQKIIRFRPKVITAIYHGEIVEYDTQKFLDCVILILVLHPGSFVPDIQRFVSGTESALKRVLVSLFEDAYISENNEGTALKVAVGAFLAQRLPGWKPNESMILNTMMLANLGVASPEAFIFDIPSGMKTIPYTISEKSKPLEVVSSLMDELKSFHSDLGMIRNEVKNRYSKKERTTYLPPRPNSMPIEHCIDQHWAPEIAYMFPREFIEENKSPGNAPFSGLFIRIFSEVTGVNPRRPGRKGKTMAPKAYDKNFEELEFTRITRKAQNLVLLSKQYTPIPRVITARTYHTLKYSLDRSWIAGMMGAVEVRGRPNALVTLHPDEPEVLIAVRKPSRDMKTPFLTDEQEVYAIETVKDLLITEGIHLSRSNPPISAMKNSRLFLDENGEYVIELSPCKTRVKWDEFREGTIQIPYVTDVGLDLENSLKYDGEGILPNADEKLRTVLRKTLIEDVQKAVTYIGRNASIFEFKRIGRDGDGTQGVVSVADVGAYHLLMKIKMIYPSAFNRVPGNALKFKIGVAPLLWHIRNIITEFLSTSGTTSYKKWGNLGEKRGRVLWEHQISSVEEMKKSHIEGKRGSFLWLSVGLGKTLVVLTYLKWLHSQKSLPKYVVYTLPSSAMSSIMKEIESYGFEYRLMIPLLKLDKVYLDKNGKPQKHIIHGATPEPYVVNLIEHDHLRRCEKELPEYMSNCIFVIDEVHKALNDTKRTSVALQLSYLCKEFIALTGTPVIDTNTYKLIWWLEQIVNFEVNEKNFWVAANGMIAKRANTGKEIVRSDIEIDLPHDVEKEYMSLVPPNLGGNNSHPRSEDFARAMEICYDVVDDEMIKQLSTLLKEKHRVFVVARDVKHQSKLHQIISQKVSKDVFSISSRNHIFLTEDSVKKGEVKPYKIVITTVRHVEGYTLTYLDTMITGVYPSNNASREQLEGRINRICQKSDKVYYITLHCGILTHIYQRHKDARNLSAVLSALADEVKN